MKNLFKNIWAIIAGFIVIVVLSTGTDLVLEKIGVFPPLGTAMGNSLLMLALIYRSAYTVLGGYVIATLSAEKPMRNIIISGVIGTILGVLGAIGGWNLSAHWYPIAIVLTGFPFVWLGGKLRIK